MWEETWCVFDGGGVVFVVGEEGFERFVVEGRLWGVCGEKRVK